MKQNKLFTFFNCLSIFYISLIIVDMIQTYYGLNYLGLIEKNYISKYLFSVIGMEFTFILKIIIIMGLLHIYKKINTAYGYIVLGIAVPFQVITIVQNFGLIFT